MDDKYLKPGDLVKLNKDLPNAPVMMVLRKETSLLYQPGDKEGPLRGLRCRWFTTDGHMEEAVWNTKDLMKLSK